MTVRSDVVGFSGATISSGFSATMFTVPADRTLIVKDVRVFCRAATAAVLVTYRHVSGGGTAVPLQRVSLAQGATMIIDQAFIVAREGFSLQLVNDGAVSATLDWCVSGALLLGDPS